MCGLDLPRVETVALAVMFHQGAQPVGTYRHAGVRGAFVPYEAARHSKVEAHGRSSGHRMLVEHLSVGPMSMLPTAWAIPA